MREVSLKERLSGNICGIYMIINPKGSIYVGSSKNIMERFRTYKKLNCKKQVKLYRSFVKYGVLNHKFIIIEECEFKYLLIRESKWGHYYNVLDRKNLNLYLPPSKFNSGISEETREKHRQKRKGKTWTEEAKRKLSQSISGENNHFYGKTHSDEVKRRLREINLGRKHTKETLEKMKGRPSNVNKLVIDMYSGIFYESYREAHDSLGYKIDYSSFCRWLRTGRHNRTSMMGL